MCPTWKIFWEDQNGPRGTLGGPGKDQGRQFFTSVPGNTGLFNGYLISKSISLWVKFQKVPNYYPEHILFGTSIWYIVLEIEKLSEIEPSLVTYSRMSAAPLFQ